MANFDLISTLEELIENGDFPDESFSFRHLNKIYDEETVADGKIRFWIDRHPHLFGRESIGKESSAYIPISYQYELDTSKKSVTLIKEEKGDPAIDYYALAIEDIYICKEGGSFDFEDELQKIKTKKEAIRFAENKFEDFNWLALYEADEKPSDFNDKLLREVKDLFKENVIEMWQEFRENS